MHVQHNWTSPYPEWWIEYNARQSAPKNRQRMLDGELTPQKLIEDCLREGHWSPFEHATMSIEIVTSMPICVQILRHGKGFSFQQFSQRYADPLAAGLEFEPLELRYQAKDKRQGSSDEDVAEGVAAELNEAIAQLRQHSIEVYNKLVAAGMAREVSREVLLQGIQTRFTVTGPFRTYITYLRTRLKKGTQEEHRRVALAIAAICDREVPLISGVEGWQPFVEPWQTVVSPEESFVALSWGEHRRLQAELAYYRQGATAPFVAAFLSPQIGIPPESYTALSWADHFNLQSELTSYRHNAGGAP